MTSELLAIFLIIFSLQKVNIIQRIFSWEIYILIVYIIKLFEEFKTTVSQIKYSRKVVQA